MVLVYLDLLSSNCEVMETRLNFFFKVRKLEKTEWGYITMGSTVHQEEAHHNNSELQDD